MYQSINAIPDMFIHFEIKTQTFLNGNTFIKVPPYTKRQILYFFVEIF